MDKAKPFDIPKRELWEAFKKVKANQGAAGVDGQTIADFEADLSNNLYKLWNRLSSGSYFPPPVRRVDIPKGDGGTRPLGIPTVADRVAQEVVRRYLEPCLEPVFHADSYGYRPGKSAIDAVRDRKSDLIFGLWDSSRSHGQKEDDLKVEYLFEDRLIVAAGKQSSWARRRKLDLAELANQPWVMAQPSNWSYRVIADAFRVRRLAMPPVCLMTVSVPLRAYFLGQGDYVGSFPRHALGALAERYGLVPLPVKIPDCARSIAVVTLRNRTLTPLVERFVHCAREIFDTP